MRTGLLIVTFSFVPIAAPVAVWVAWLRRLEDHSVAIGHLVANVGSSVQGKAS